MRAYLYSISFLILVLCTGIAHASDIPHTIAHQGILTSNDGTPVEDGMYSFSVSIYDSESSSDALWTETQTVGVINGIYNLMLGAVEPLGLGFDIQYWLGISVNSGDELNPRIPLSSVPYAFHALSVPDGSITSFKLADEAVTQEKIHPDVSLPISGNAGGDLAGTYPNPVIAQGSVNTVKLADGAVTSGKIASNIDIITTGTIDASSLKGDGSQITGIQVDEIALPFSGETSIPQLDGPAFLVRNAASGTAIRGEATATSGTGFGVYGRSNSTTGLGVHGLAFASSGINYGVHGQSFSTSGRGVYGFASATSGTTYGVYGRADSPDGHGVYGEAIWTSGENYGVYGRSNSSSGIGVYGAATNSSDEALNYGVYGISIVGIGVVGEATSERGHRSVGVSGRAHFRGVEGFATGTNLTNFGVYGVTNSDATNATGVRGLSNSRSGVNFGVHGQANSPDGYGVYSQGRFAATGTKDFQIDHPLDPANKFLNHFSAEGPQPYLIYKGSITLNENGGAWVELPDYFEAINREVHYQLTPIGGSAPELHIAQEVTNNRFQISGGNPGLKVSWTVMGIRDDPFVRNNPVSDVQSKPIENRGRYLHPEYYGQAETMGIFYDERWKIDMVDNSIDAYLQH